jgi:hypothetical protein
VRVVVENIFGVCVEIVAPVGMDADACACRAVEMTGIPCRAKEISDGQG